MKLKTKELQSIIAVLSKSVGNNQDLPITTLINFLEDDGDVIVTTTDGVTYTSGVISLVESSKKPAFSEFSVSADQFIKLVNKTTSEFIELKSSKLALEFKGNGQYKIEYLFDEDNEPVKFPDKSVSTDNTIFVKRSSFTAATQYNKPCLASEKDIEYLSHYYFGDNIVTSNTLTACITNGRGFGGDHLISSKVVDLISMMEDSEVSISIDGSTWCITSGLFTIITDEPEGIDKFPIAQIMKLNNIEYSNTCKLDKSLLLAALDRLSIFVGPFDNGEIDVTISNNTITLTNPRHNGVEVITMNEDLAEDRYKFEFTIVGNLLRGQIVSNVSDKVLLCYGNQPAISIVEHDVTKVISIKGLR